MCYYLNVQFQGQSVKETQVFLNVTPTVLVNDCRRLGGGYSLYDFLKKLACPHVPVDLFIGHYQRCENLIFGLRSCVKV
jgi:hypothetical protein